MHCAVFAVHGPTGTRHFLRDVTPGSIPDAPHEPTAPACPLLLRAHSKSLPCVAQATLAQGGVDSDLGPLDLISHSVGSLLWIARSDLLSRISLSSRISQQSDLSVADRSFRSLSIRISQLDRSFGSLTRIVYLDRSIGSLTWFAHIYTCTILYDSVRNTFDRPVDLPFTFFINEGSSSTLLF